jgi:membrane-associated phospholipid phosphatase/predicted MFS family arabinose efflux permease
MSTVAVTAGELAARTPVNRRTPYLVAFAAAAAGAGLGRAVTTTYLPVLLDRISDAPALIGAVMLVNAAAGLAVPLVVGVWSDRLRARGVGRTRPFVWGGSLLTAGGLAATAFGASSSYLVLALTGAVVYIGLNSMTTAHRALIPELFSPERRARATSAQELAMLGGGLIGLAVGGALTGISLWAPFLLAAVLVPLLALPTLRRVSEQGAVGERDGESRPLGYYLSIARRPRVRSLLLAQWLWVLGYAALPTFFVLYAERELSLSAATASVLLAGFGVGTGAATLAAGRAKTPERLRGMLLVGVVALGGGMLAVSASTSLASVAPALLAAALGFGLVNTVGFALFSTLIPEGEAGGYTALFFSVRAISSAAALPAAGVVVEVTGTYRALFVLGGVATLAALVPLLGLTIPRGRFTRIAALLAVVPVAGLLVAQTKVHLADEALFERVNGLGPGPDWLWFLLDPHTRNYLVLIAFAVAVAALTNARRVPGVFGRVLGSAVLSWGLLEAVYAVYDRARPEEVVGSIEVNGHSWGHLNSFPSGHMAITAALAVATALAFPRLRALLWTYVAAVAFTRVMFGAHFPLDVLAGTALGTASALLVALPFDRRRPQRTTAELGPIDANAVAAVMPSHGDVPTRALIDEVLEHVDSLVLVDDGSDVDVARRLDDLAGSPGVELVRLRSRSGKGSAVRAGVDRLVARANPPEAVLVIDADGQHPASAIPAFLAAGGNADLVVGDRFGDLDDMPLQRRLANRATCRLFRLATGREVRDTQNGMRLLRGRALATLPAGGYEAETRHLKRVLVSGLQVAWVPIPAIYGEEHSHFRPLADSARVLWAVLAPSPVRAA